MKKVALMALAGALAAGSANAQISQSGISFTPGVYGITNSTATIFETFGGNPASTAPTGGVQFGSTVSVNGTATTAGLQSATSLANGYVESRNGSAIVFPGSQNMVGQGVNPDGGNDNYLAVGGDGNSGTFTVNFGGAAEQYFSFAFGSLDSYNSLTLTFANGLTQTFTGLGIIGGTNTATGTAPTPYGQTGRVSYNAQGGSGITQATFGSSQAAFEIDDLAAAAPEPATWAMMMIGFGVVGSSLRLRRRKANIALA